MDKLQIAHEYALEMAKQGIPLKSCKELGWKYADAMQAEADKRKPSGLPEVLREEWQPDWSQAPFDCNWFAVDSDGSAYFYSYKPYIKDGYPFWGGLDITNDGYSYEVESNFGYTGNWQDSLRKRPQ